MCSGAYLQTNDAQRERERVTPVAGVMPGYYTTLCITLLSSKRLFFVTSYNLPESPAQSPRVTPNPTAQNQDAGAELSHEV